ncbi:MAG TPA: VCBS repeat-containing protein [Steroidobacteraceae bacterium]|nr:VCBS repeat-containing protein [Steroidobacteraceae bacterium]
MVSLPNRVGTLSSQAAVAGLAVAFGTLSGCYDDNNPNLPPIIPTPNSIVVADVNGDGSPDLLVATTADEGYALNPGYADVILNTAGTFQTGVHYSTTGTNPSSIQAVDLTGGNGPVDLIIANFGSGSVSVFMHGASLGTFDTAVDVVTGGQPNHVVASDLNGDGKPDLVLADMSSTGNAIVLLADPAHPGQFLAMNLPTGLTTPSVAVGDLDRDGFPDIVAAVYDSAGNNGAVMVFYQNPDGSFRAPVSVPAGAQPQSVKIADVNGDGRPDLIVANFGPGADGMGAAGVSVLLQDTAGSFSTPVTYTTPGGSIDVAVADVNDDQKPDLVVANLAPSNTGSVSVLLQDPDPAHPGEFLAATTYPALSQPLSVTIADLNGDHHPDIAIADGPSAGVLMQDAASPGKFGAVTQVGF